MKFRVYVLLLLLIVPLQSSILRLVVISGVTPDIALVAVYIIGLLTGPREGAYMGIGLGLIQDIHSAGLIGLTGFTRGVMGLLAGLLGRHVLNVASMSNLFFITGFSLIEGILLSVFMDIYYGDISFFSILFNRMLPNSLYTGVVGAVMLRLLHRYRIIDRMTQGGFEREVIRGA